MRIALLTYSTRPRGGVVHTLALAEALAARGHGVDVWTLARGDDAGFYRRVDRSVGQRVVPFADVEGEAVGARILRSIDALRAAFDDTGYDVVHAQDCISANAVQRCLRTVHHLDTFTTPELAACHERALVRPAGHVCVSAAVAEQLRAGWGIEATVIANGVDAERFTAADGSLWRSSLGRYVVSVGGIEPRKGSADLIEAMALVQRLDPSLRLVVVGGETLFDYRAYRAAVLDRALELGLDVDLLGVVPEADLPGIVAGAAAFAFPSVKEGFGLAALEALAAGVPVVMRDLPVLREVFGASVAFASDVAQLAQGLLGAAAGPDPTRAEAGRSLAASYTWAAAAGAHERFYEQQLRASAS